MAFGLNRVELIGRLGADVTVNHLTSGGRVANLSVATDESYLNKQTGERVDKTEWHRIVTFQDGLITMFEKHAKKGRLVYIDGKLQTRRWSKPGEDGDRFSTEILLVPGGRVQFLDKPNGANGERLGSARDGARERPGHAGRHRLGRRPTTSTTTSRSRSSRCFSLPPPSRLGDRRFGVGPPFAGGFESSRRSPSGAPLRAPSFALEREHAARHRQHLRPRGGHRSRLRHPRGGGAHPPSHRRGAVDDRYRPPSAALRLPLRVPGRRLAGAGAGLPAVGRCDGRAPPAPLRRRAPRCSAS